MWLRSNNTCPTCRAELFNDGPPRTRVREQVRQEQPRGQRNEGEPFFDSQHGQIQMPGEIREMLRGVSLEEGELEMQEHLWSVARGPSPPEPRRRGAVGNIATRQNVIASQPDREAYNAQAHRQVPISGQQHQVLSNNLISQAVAESFGRIRTASLSGATDKSQGEPRSSVIVGQTTSRGDQNRQHSEDNREMTRDEISALYTQLGVDRSRILVCDSAAMSRLVERLRSVQHARPDWHNQISDLDELYTFEVTGDLFRFSRISYDWPSWYNRVSSRNERRELMNAFFAHRREWKDKVASYLRAIAPDRLDSEVHRLKQEETGDPLQERILKNDVWF